MLLFIDKHLAEIRIHVLDYSVQCYSERDVLEELRMITTWRSSYPNSGHICTANDCEGLTYLHIFINKIIRHKLRNKLRMKLNL